MTITNKTALNYHVPAALYSPQYGLCSATKHWMYRKYCLQTDTGAGSKKQAGPSAMQNQVSWR